MKALIHERYGSPEVLRFADAPDPVAEGDRVLVRVRAASVNPVDLRLMEGDPWIIRLSEGLARPKRAILGVDVAGVVEAVGPDVEAFRPGDEVFGGCAGSLAELVRPREPFLAHKPAGVSFESAAALPTAACTALIALRDKAEVRAGQRVMIIGASGGVGTFAVQIARSMGAQVTGVCSGRNAELVASLGADAVIDYTARDHLAERGSYDAIVDAAGGRGLLPMARALRRGGNLVLIGAGGGRLLGPLAQMIRAKAVAPLVGRRMSSFLANVKRADLELLAGMVERGEMTSVIERGYSLSEGRSALEHLATKRARGKIIVTPG